MKIKLKYQKLDKNLKIKNFCSSTDMYAITNLMKIVRYKTHYALSVFYARIVLKTEFSSNCLLLYFTLGDTHTVVMHK